MRAPTPCFNLPMNNLLRAVTCFDSAATIRPAEAEGELCFRLSNESPARATDHTPALLYNQDPYVMVHVCGILRQHYWLCYPVWLAGRRSSNITLSSQTSSTGLPGAICRSSRWGSKGQKTSK